MSLKVLTESDVTPENTCVFCKKNTVDELKFGSLYYRDGVATHYFCMLFSAALKQSGSDDQGILGFLPLDVAKEVRRSMFLKCCYCEGTGASVGCCKKSCRKAFHFPCGLQHGANYQFFRNFESFCEDHKTERKITLKKSDWICPVCLTPVSAAERPIQASCCKAAVFHTDCMQEVALNAGYFFKCPTCNDTQNFRYEMRSLGIYVPQQDASWEREPNAFEDLLYQYSKCDAETCECQEGREHVTEKGKWALARCRTCGASGMHKACGNLRNIDNWPCAACLEIEKKADLEKKRLKKENAQKKLTLAASSSRIEQKIEENEYNDNDGNFNMANIKINKSCQQYFPYDMKELHNYCNKGSLPDWRNLQLTVNLTDWLKFVKIAPQKCNSKQNNDNNDKKKRERQPEAMVVDNADIISEKSVDEALPMLAEREKPSIKIAEEKLKDFSAVGEKDSVSFDVNEKEDFVLQQNYQESSSAKPKSSIFPLESKSVKSRELISKKRKSEINLESGPVPAKMLAVLDDSAISEDGKLDSGVSTQSQDVTKCGKSTISTVTKIHSWSDPQFTIFGSYNPIRNKSFRSKPMHGGGNSSLSS